jgi:ribonuclease R
MSINNKNMEKYYGKRYTDSKEIEQRIFELLSRIPLYEEEILSNSGMEADPEIFHKILNRMEEEGRLIRTKKKKYAIPETLGFFTGRLQANARGFGFFISDNEGEEDIFISAENLNGAMHRDRVMIRLIKGNGRSREGEVVRVLERANTKIVGTFEKEKNFGFVIPDDQRIHQDIFIPKDAINGAKHGYKVVAEIVHWPQKRRNPEGRIIEVLGHRDEVGTDILSIIRQFDLPEVFPDEVQGEAKKIPQTIPEDEIKRRKDYRNLLTITMDGADAKDLDDAISLEMKTNGNYLLGVHIADVSYYVRENKEIDREAYRRGTSVYLVDRVIPMLPKELSNGICSLNPNEDRLAFSVFMEINSKGTVVDYRFEETIIRSDARLVYEDITKVLEGKDPELIEEYRDFLEFLQNMESLANILRDKRMKRGSIDFDLEETKITLDITGKPIDVKQDERGISNRIIEEFMLVCNETVAEAMTWSGVPFLYRVHEEPSVEKLLDFNKFINNFGYHLKGIGGKIHPKALQDLLEEIRGKREEVLISTVMLRSLQKAKYSSDNIGHFGLAAKYYTHFTAPIRRYPDLIIHRIMKDFLANRLDKKRIQYLNDKLPETANHCSERERLADEVERETDRLKKAEYMADKIGMEFDGIISGVTSFGVFVILDNTVEGLIRITALDDDYYVYDEKHYCLIGERTKKVYRLGDDIKIRVANVDIPSRTIDFVLA